MTLKLAISLAVAAGWLSVVIAAIEMIDDWRGPDDRA